ncbi:MAG: hypothetical protein HY849_06735 [Nitrosomonadales bacterium]|nr:hypothetical protein [Nitrosomonadales bacterium]
MNTLQHIVEPIRLLLTWQPSDEQAHDRTRRVVGEVYAETNGEIVFRYLKDSSDYQAACEAGFQGFTAFENKSEVIRHGVVEALIRRLPPRKRDDFSDFLRQHRLPSPFPNSDLALLGYTGARLPSDGFALVPEFPRDAIPCDYLMEVAGLRHVFRGSVSENIHVGDPVHFEIDSQNPVDADALVVVCAGQRIGYVNRVIKSTFHNWLKSHQVVATVERLNGKPTRPLVYIRVSVS